MEKQSHLKYFDKGTIENPKLNFTAYSEAKFTEEVKDLVADRISFFLSLEDNLKEFYEIAQKDQYIQPAIKQFYGHKQVKFLTPFEIACWAILSPKNTHENSSQNERKHCQENRRSN